MSEQATECGRGGSCAGEQIVCQTRGRGVSARERTTRIEYFLDLAGTFSRYKTYTFHHSQLVFRSFYSSLSLSLSIFFFLKPRSLLPFVLAPFLLLTFHHLRVLFPLSSSSHWRILFFLPTIHLHARFARY